HANSRFRPLYPSEHAVRFLFGARSSFPPELPRRFLDIGTGAGRHMLLAAEAGFSPVGVDVSWNGLHHARERLSAKNVGPLLAVAAMGELPFVANTFSVVLSYGVFYYGTANDMKRALNETWRVLRPGGRLLVVLRSTRDYRHGKGQQLEPNTFRLEIDDTNELGTVQHFVTAEDIPAYFGKFSSVTFESSELTFGNRSRLDSDWVITAEK